ncbi:MAG: hypothetical protein NTY91_01180, partial [Euryarchaeota archaeon]|nr:hypothetical protein [Euryarchaeota archaeon]
MKKKLVGIVVFMLVTTTVVSATNIDLKKNIQTIASRDILSFNNKIETYQPVDFNWGMFNWGVDQKQTKTDRYGITLYPPDTNAQSFTPTKDKLTAVSLYIFRFGAPPEPVQITVSIRDNLSGSDLATKTIDTSVVKINKSTWVLFDFEDIPVTPGNKYYIVCQGTAGNPTNAYCWLYSFNDTYPRGDAWYKANEGSSWIQWPNGPQSPKDFCFKTYFRKPLDIPVPNQSNEISNEKTIAVYAQPFSLQFHRDQTPIVQPTDITSSQNRNPSVVGTDAQVTTFTE